MAVPGLPRRCGCHLRVVALCLLCLFCGVVFAYFAALRLPLLRRLCLQDLTFESFCGKILHGNRLALTAHDLFSSGDVDVLRTLGERSALDILSPLQTEWLSTYRTRFGTDKLIFDLSQNPGAAGRPRVSLVDGAAPCFTTNSARLWSALPNDASLALSSSHEESLPMRAWTFK